MLDRPIILPARWALKPADRVIRSPGGDLRAGGWVNNIRSEASDWERSTLREVSQRQQKSKQTDSAKTKR